MQRITKCQIGLGFCPCTIVSCLIGIEIRKAVRIKCRVASFRLYALIRNTFVRDFNLYLEREEKKDSFIF